MIVKTECPQMHAQFLISGISVRNCPILQVESTGNQIGVYLSSMRHRDEPSSLF